PAPPEPYPPSLHDALPLLRRSLPLAVLSCLLASTMPAALAQALPAPAPPLTLSQVMADPDWIGNAVEDYWWTWDGSAAQYQRKRDRKSTRLNSSHVKISYA